ncbi:MAG: hypothetical protein WDN69_26540 [Aliidongia sp.]
MLGVRLQPVAAVVPPLTNVAKAVAATPVSTERLDGSTAAASGESTKL